MKILLPPSETKVPGGGSVTFAPNALAFPSLLPQRERVVDALMALAADAAASARSLKISQRHIEAAITANAALGAAPGMPAIERYTGVLFDALDVLSLDPAARSWIDANVFVHSAPFGPVSASDPLPDYRMSAGATIAALGPLKRFWADATTQALAALADDFVLDLRSEAYVALGPLSSAKFARFVTDGPDGPRALNHFNKKGKGELVRSLAASAVSIESVSELIDWGTNHGWRIADGGDELIVVVAS